MASSKKLSEKREKDEKETALVFQEFLKTFQGVTPDRKTFVKSGEYPPGTSEVSADEGNLYQPTPLVKPTEDLNIKALKCARLVKYDDSQLASHSKSNLESLHDEIKSHHTQRHRSESGNTTLQITKLSRRLHEESIKRIFSVFGPVVSVEMAYQPNRMAYVTFMHLKDCEIAYANMRNRKDMCVSWDKPANVPEHTQSQSQEPPSSGLPFNAQPIKGNVPVPDNAHEMEKLLFDATVTVTIPKDRDILRLIHKMIEFVIREGPGFEAIIMSKEQKNPSYQFLFNNKSPTHVYYRWKLYSMMNGDKPAKWSTKPFRMFQGGPIWIPPPVPGYAPPKPIFKPLPDSHQHKLIQILNHLTMRREDIRDALMFCMENAECSKDIVNIICESLSNPQTIATKKIARLYLISDILYNTKFKKYPLRSFQDLFEKSLKTIFEQLGLTYKQLANPIDKTAVGERVIKVLCIWTNWHVYPRHFLDELELIFLGQKCLTHTPPPLGNKLPPKEKHAKVAKIENAPVQTEQASSANFVQSKWETLDPAVVESQAISCQQLQTMSAAPIETGKIGKAEKVRESDRDLMPKVEAKVKKYRDALETGKKKSRRNKTDEERVSAYREKCLKKARRNMQVCGDSSVSVDSTSSDDSKVERKKLWCNRYT